MNTTEKIVTVKLTEDQVNILACYILMSTNHRKREAEAWRQLSTEAKEDGTPRFPNAASNAAFWDEEEQKLMEIKRILDDAWIS